MRDAKLHGFMFCGWFVLFSVVSGVGGENSAQLSCFPWINAVFWVDFLYTVVNGEVQGGVWVDGTRLQVARESGLIEYCNSFDQRVLLLV